MADSFLIYQVKYGELCINLYFFVKAFSQKG